MTQKMTFSAPGNCMVATSAGLLCALAGLSLDLVLSGAMAGEGAKWGGMAGAFGAGIGIIALARVLISQR